VGTATGGIGGVHRRTDTAVSRDVSADLEALLRRNARVAAQIAGAVADRPDATA